MFQVLMKDSSSPVPEEDMRMLVHTCLQKAAHINYSQLLEYAQIKGTRSKTAAVVVGNHRSVTS